ncbi:MAG: hypothetical protein N4Q01_01605 [Lactobacillus iners]|uniref:hypothetical protein n=1 Tax=Lactobacillus iners TaxID=147802 RepID=UPI002A543E60|nr:hypothetical protein [Lactobacillus iners]MCT7684888.1 hypothetical protein [Lactobacillus iners]MCT7849963.1 hypothetical protein [Lactobacillus iners]
MPDYKKRNSAVGVFEKSTYGVSSNVSKSRENSPDSFLCVSFCLAACKSECHSNCNSACASNCGKACASACKSACRSSCSSMCYGVGSGSERKLEKEFQSLEDIIL